MNFDKHNYHIRQAQLPKGWERKRLEDCFKLKSGDGLTSKMMSEDGEYPVYGGNGIAGLHNEYNLSGSNVIIGRVGALCGNVRHMDAMIWLTDNAFKITDFKFDFDHSFLTYLLNFKNLREYARQAAQPVISNSSLKDVILEFPKSLPEQQRIVSILDKAFAAIDKAKANAEQNLKNAKELFESYLQGVFDPSTRSGQGQGDGWEEKTLGDNNLVEIIDGDRGKNYPTQKDFLDDGYCLFMNTKNVRPNGFSFDTTMFINQAKDKAMGKGKLKRNDVVMTTRGTIGNIGVYNDEVEFDNIRINSGMLIFRPNQLRIASNYLFEIFRSGLFKEQTKKHVSGAAQPQLPIKTLVNFTIPVPKSLKTQQTIVQKLDALNTETKKLEAIYQQKINDLEELKKSILQKAFAGELKVSELGWVGLKDDKIKMKT
ncbi:hypothetical protein G3O08_17155 [Cryomorpha ignava]|uniref:Type I restriction modification DNA specificity domain-containing protein n=1 Tax=Cryomorpha ignava TaxID=101383 RepID=A0A7K3WU73_9FLAO|nr:restriction endonuclease subunit S [Cryomorpha ignava]NEN25227.1 hypothetical protein [Cryomorpha ignava]